MWMNVGLRSAFRLRKVHYLVCVTSRIEEVIACVGPFTAQKKFSIKDFFSKCDQIRSFLRILSNLWKKSLMWNFIFCGVFVCHIGFEFFLFKLPLLYYVLILVDFTVRFPRAKSATELLIEVWVPAKLFLQASYAIRKSTKCHR